MKHILLIACLASCKIQPELPAPLAHAHCTHDIVTYYSDGGVQEHATCRYHGFYWSCTVVGKYSTCQRDARIVLTRPKAEAEDE